MKIGVVRYPGTNCFYDTIRYFGEENCIELLWDKYDERDHLDLVIIPGGFAFGDRYYEKATEEYEYSPGKMALESKIQKYILTLHEKGVPILGICNGFQILTKMGLLPGELIQNKSKTFHSKLVDVEYDFGVEKGGTKMYIANYYGNYQNNHLNEKDIFLKYRDFDNGSISNVAGIMNKERNVFGMMPHPERNSDFKETLLRNIFNHTEISHKINTLLNSEHISYRSTKQYLKTLYTEGDHVVQGPGENAGIVDVGDGYCITIRIESHNHPTYKNAFEGAATGVGGIIRDIICMGSKPIALLDFLRFGYDDNSSQLLNNAIKGIAYYGNTIGIPNVGGSLYRSEIYNKNPLVNVACLGIVKKENIIYGNALNEGSLLVLCGAKTGNEGVDSAVMASKHLTEEKEGNIQKADAYLENLLLDAFVEISDKGLAEGCQDLGAGGILCATTEVIKRGREKTKKNLGCEIYLDQIPLKSELDNYSILASETQERMLLVSSRGNYSEIRKILRKWGLEHKVIGDVNNTGCYDVYTGPKVPYNNSDNNTSRFTKNELIYTEYFSNFKEEDNHLPLSYNDNHNAIDKIKDSSLWETYDHTIGARTIKGPDHPGSFSILDLYEINKKLVITWGNNVESCHSKLKDLDASPLGVVNCLNFGDPLTCIGDFKNHIDLMNEQCKELKIPVLGGNVSMYNTTDGVDIPSSVVIVMIGLQEDQ